MVILDLNLETQRLLDARDMDKGYYVGMLTRDKKIEILAVGYLDGWYGDDGVAEKILGDHFEEVKKKAYIIYTSDLSRTKNTRYNEGDDGK